MYPLEFVMSVLIILLLIAVIVTLLTLDLGDKD